MPSRVVPSELLIVHEGVQSSITAADRNDAGRLAAFPEGWSSLDGTLWGTTATSARRTWSLAPGLNRAAHRAGPGSAIIASGRTLRRSAGPRERHAASGERQGWRRPMVGSLCPAQQAERVFGSSVGDGLSHFSLRRARQGQGLVEPRDAGLEYEADRRPRSALISDPLPIPQQAQQ